MDISVVCPFYNEAGILEHAIRTMASPMRTLEGSWELIVVNDGSVDGSGAIAERVARDYPEVRVLGYRYNKGRGHALRTGIAAARGEIVITTEIDLSWGENIVHELVAGGTTGATAPASSARHDGGKPERAPSPRTVPRSRRRVGDRPRTGRSRATAGNAAPNGAARDRVFGWHKPGDVPGNHDVRPDRWRG